MYAAMKLSHHHYNHTIDQPRTSLSSEYISFGLRIVVGEDFAIAIGYGRMYVDVCT